MTDNCIVCDGLLRDLNFYSDSSVTSDQLFLKKPIHHQECLNCGLISIKDEFQLDVEDFYENEYNFLPVGDDEPISGETKYSEYLLNFISEFLVNTSSFKFFDIGAGKGNFIETVYKKYDQLSFFALEPSKSFEKLKAKKFIKKKYNNFFKSNIVGTDKYSFVSLVGVLEHVNNPVELLNEVKDVMGEDSYLLVEVPNFENNKTDILVLDHILKFYDYSIEYLFQLTGLEIVKKEIDGRVPMRYVLKKKGFKTLNVSAKKRSDLVENSIAFINRRIELAKKLKNSDIAIYGQGLILDYLVGKKILNIGQIKCIIDDNPFYVGSYWRDSIEILNFDSFVKTYSNVDIFLAMNDCYFEKVTKKIESSGAMICS